MGLVQTERGGEMVGQGWGLVLSEHNNGWG